MRSENNKAIITLQFVVHYNVHVIEIPAATSLRVASYLQLKSY